MLKVTKIVLALLATVFILIAMRWLVTPAGVATEFGFELAHGLGRSSQIGDMFGYFLTTGVCVLVGVVSGQRVWFYPPMLLLFLTSIGRLVAWLVHDAAFATGPLMIEVVSISVLLIASRLFARAETAPNQ